MASPGCRKPASGPTNSEPINAGHEASEVTVQREGTRSAGEGTRHAPMGARDGKAAGKRAAARERTGATGAEPTNRAVTKFP